MSYWYSFREGSIQTPCNHAGQRCEKEKRKKTAYNSLHSNDDNLQNWRISAGSAFERWTNNSINWVCWCGSSMYWRWILCCALIDHRECLTFSLGTRCKGLRASKRRLSKRSPRINNHLSCYLVSPMPRGNSSSQSLALSTSGFNKTALFMLIGFSSGNGFSQWVTLFFLQVSHFFTGLLGSSPGQILYHWLWFPEVSDPSLQAQWALPEIWPYFGSLCLILYTLMQSEVARLNSLSIPPTLCSPRASKIPSWDSFLACLGT